MRGKIINLCIGGMNILFGILLLVYTLYIPKEVIEFTVQELSVISIVKKAIYGLLILVVFIDVFQYRNNRDNSKMKTGYLFGFFALSFVLIKEPMICIFSILCGIVVSIETWKDTVVEIDSTTGISIVALIMVATLLVTGTTIFYKNIAQSIKNKENEGSREYEQNYFKYITELDITEPYINVKKDGKYGYINPKGDVVIDFVYDYASPFVNITVYNKDFQVALVSQDGTSQIILKNQREVMSYRSESADGNYEAKKKELEHIYKNILGQGGQMQTEIEKRTDAMERAPRYEETSDEYTYRYDYNDKYDIIITQSNLGLGDTFELAKKENLNIRFGLNANNLDYDEDYVYLYSNRNIPFFNLASKEQGWFTGYGKKNVMSGKAQILDFIEDKMLIKNYNNNTIYFINTAGDILSDVYKNIYILQEKYIVKNNNYKYMVIDQEFKKIFEEEFDAVDPYLADYGLYICCNTDQVIEFNDYGFAKMNWKLVNEQGQTILDGIEQIYGNNYQISNDKEIPYVDRYEQFLEQLKSMEFHFVGDKFYDIYRK